MFLRRQLILPVNIKDDFDASLDEFLAIWQNKGISEIFKNPPSKETPMCYINFSDNPSTTSKLSPLPEQELKKEEQPSEETASTPLNPPSLEDIVCPKLDEDSGTGVGAIPKEEGESDNDEEDEDTEDDDDDDNEKEKKEEVHPPAPAPPSLPQQYWTQEDIEETIRLTKMDPHYSPEGGHAYKCLPKDLKSPTRCAFCDKRLSAETLKKLWQMNIKWEMLGNHGHDCAWKKMRIQYDRASVASSGFTKIKF